MTTMHRTHRRSKTAKSTGLSSRMFHFGLRVGQGWRPTLTDLLSTYRCSRATAYRLHALLRDVDAPSKGSMPA